MMDMLQVHHSDHGRAHYLLRKDHVQQNCGGAGRRLTV